MRFSLPEHDKVRLSLKTYPYDVFSTKIIDTSDEGARIVTWHPNKADRDDSEEGRIAYIRNNAHLIIKDLASALRSVHALTQEMSQGVEQLRNSSTVAPEKTDTTSRIVTFQSRDRGLLGDPPVGECVYVVEIHFKWNAHQKEAFEKKAKALAGCANLLHFSEEELQDAIGVTFARIPKLHARKLSKYRGVLGSLHIRLLFTCDETAEAIRTMSAKINKIIDGGPLEFGPKDLADVTSVQWVDTQMSHMEDPMLYEGFFQKITGPDTKPVGCIQLETPTGILPNRDLLGIHDPNDGKSAKGEPADEGPSDNVSSMKTIAKKSNRRNRLDYCKYLELQFVHLQERDSVELANQSL